MEEVGRREGARGWVRVCTLSGAAGLVAGGWWRCRRRGLSWEERALCWSLARSWTDGLFVRACAAGSCGRQDWGNDGSASGDDSEADSELAYEMELENALESSYQEYLTRKVGGRGVACCGVVCCSAPWWVVASCRIRGGDECG